MARVTKLFLEQQCARLAADNSALRAENSRLKASLEARRTPKAVSPRKAAMEMARKIAMETGKTTRVQQ